jgi:hypothetical protein
MAEIGPISRLFPHNISINYLPYMDPKNRKQIHDHFFRESMARISIAKGILFTFISSNLLKSTDFSTFEIVVKQLLQKKMSVEFIRETTGLTRKRIEEIKKNMN